ncbi:MULTISPECIES: hypothetical protein [unclassified Colwellia]|uniref:hypothetical protein n=1 Tax=unclassified Colwellia TaxID=196834 RepID=UPI0015F6E7F9|nr:MULTISPECIES: hypothetical protein [unclassified Colwellia]MBA6232783.1 hypothetical protein [Colwellia sp. MB02u-7]MBA6236124.1 hypothetical protein [Colwellia sp. MB02u-11]MBA6256622.1 hypothetical protein [Colwellia sp. MB3u-28]MBA6261337.1 hypothetical protein [Colwellia sp. MB3u-41]MBA6298471.1 hypothetical protein [Colwellia sp. MB3u-22]
MALELATTTAANELIHRRHIRGGIRRLLHEGIADARKALLFGPESPLDANARDLVVVANELLDGVATSPTIQVLSDQFVDREFNPRGPVVDGTRRRFLRPTPPLDPNATGRSRTISRRQVDAYKLIRDKVIRNELSGSTKFYSFYHAQTPRMRIAQDLYKKVYEKYYRRPVPADFHFFRYPGPNDRTFAEFDNVTDFLVAKIEETGMIDDNDGGTKRHIISANLSLFGSLGHAGEETFHYFQIGEGQTPLDPRWFIEKFFGEFGFDTAPIAQLMAAAELTDTVEGSLFQIMVPADLVDDVAYMAHPHGIPFDDELLDDLHYVGDIQYRWQDLEPGSALAREKMNDELTRKLKLFPQRPAVVPGPPVPLRSALRTAHDPKPPVTGTKEERDKLADDNMSRRYRLELNELTRRTILRARQGHYRPSVYLQRYGQDSSQFHHPQQAHFAQRQREAPDHIGHGKESPHELIRIQNRPLFMQARLLLSQAHMLDPASGIRIFRHTTVAPPDQARYERTLDQMADVLIHSSRPRWR